MALSDRQTQILKAVIQEYTQTAQPVGSITLEKKYNLGISPATIRNEMVALTKSGFLSQPHTSAGRTPTPMALKYYVRELLKEEELSVAEEVAVKEKVWDHRFDTDQFFRQITKALADKTHTLAVACATNKIYHAGYANILEMPEFFDIDVTKAVLSLIDEYQQLQSLFQKATSPEAIHILVGEDLEDEQFQSLGLVFSDFKVKDKFEGCIGVIGPYRLNYPSLVPTVKYFTQLVEEIAKNW